MVEVAFGLRVADCALSRSVCPSGLVTWISMVLVERSGERTHWVPCWEIDPARMVMDWLCPVVNCSGWAVLTRSRSVLRVWWDAMARASWARGRSTKFI